MKKYFKMLISFAVVFVCCVCVFSITPKATAVSDENEKWVAAWGTAPAEVNMNGMSIVGSLVGDVTVRVVLTPSASGEKFRIKLSNHYGTQPLRIQNITAAYSKKNSQIDISSLKYITFNDGSPDVTVAPGDYIYSDPVSLHITAGQPIAISMFINEYQDVGTMGLSGATTYFTTGEATRTEDYDKLKEVFDEQEMLDIMSKILEGFSGNSTLDVKLAYNFIKFIPAIETIDVLTDGTGYSVVVAGDSTVANDFPNHLGQIIVQQDNIQNIGVIGKGIVGNSLTIDDLGLGKQIYADSLRARLKRDVLSQSGVEYVIIKIGANDIIFPVSADIRTQYPDMPMPTAENIISAFQRIFKDCHDAGVKVIVTSITQWKGNNRDYFGEGIPQYNRTEEEFRKDWKIAQEVNDWLANTTEHDGFVDLTEISANPLDRDALLSEYTTDGMNPSDACQRFWANYFPRSLLGVGSKPGSVRIQEQDHAMFAGQQKQIVAEVLPETAIDKSLIWESSAPEIVSVDENGVVTAIGNGTAVISCTTVVGGFKASCNVSVTTRPESIMLDYTERDIYTTKSVTLEAIVLPETANDRSVKWTSSNKMVATVDKNGKVTGVGAGTAMITATTNVGGLTASCIINVTKKREVQTVTITNNGEPITSKTLYLNDVPKTVFGHIVSPTNANFKEVIWSSSNPRVATVDALGNVKAVSEGVTAIKCTSEDNPYAVATCTLYVKIKVMGVEISQSELSVFETKSKTLSADILPTGASNKKLEWSSSNESIATVDKNGKVTGVKPGTTTITVKAGNGRFSSSCKVTVKQIVYSEKIKLNKTSITLDDGKSFELSSTVYPENTTTKTVTWSSSNTKVVKVDSYGEVTAVNPGTAYIYCKTKDGGATVKCKVTVKEVKATSISFSASSTTIEYSKTKTLKPTIKPSNTTDKTLIWKSSNPKVVSVDKNGKIKGLKAGQSAVITATTKNGKLTAKITVKVNPIGVSKITLNRTSQSLSKGKTFTLTATVKPANATNKALTWISSNPKVATVDKNGKVTALKNGTATITCKSANGKKVTCTVTVRKISVVDIQLDKRSVLVDKGATFNIVAIITPGNATNQKVTWKSSDKSIAKVSSSGKVTAVAPGVCQITATTSDGGFTAVCMITVK